jgi:hypothetical protein
MTTGIALQPGNADLGLFISSQIHEGAFEPLFY